MTNIATTRRFAGLSERGSFLGLLGLFFLFRLSALISYRPGGYVVDWTERYFFVGWLRYVDAGYFPYRDFWMEYPPLLPWYGIVTYWLSQNLPPWIDPTLWFSLTSGLPLILAECGILTLVYLLTRRTFGHWKGMLAAACYATLVVPLYFFLSGYDGFSVWTILLVLACLLPGKARWALAGGIVLGLGIQYKLVPVIVAPVALAVFARRREWRSLAIFSGAAAVTILVIAIPVFLMNPEMTTASYASILTRSSWETVWALLDGYFGGGLVAPLDTRFDASVAYLPQHSSVVPGFIPLGLGALALGFGLWKIRDWDRPGAIAAGGLFAVSILFLASKGYSTQFLTYLLPLLLVVWPNGRGMVYALLLSLINILEWPVWLALLGSSPEVLTVLVLTRTVLLVVIAVDAWHAMYGASIRLPVRRIYPVIASSTAISLVVLVGTVYVRDAYGREPYRAVTEALQTGSGSIVITDEALYRSIRPYLGAFHRIILADPNRPANVLNEGDVRVVFAGTEADREANRRIEQTVSTSRYPMGETWLDTARISDYVRGDPAMTARDVQYGIAVRLAGSGLQESARVNEPVRVRLDWEKLSGADVQVFVHAIDSEGKLVAQSDGPPVHGFRPLNGWAANEIVSDRRTLRIESPGDYRILVGWYGQSGRLPVDTGGDAFEIGVVRVRQ